VGGGAYKSNVIKPPSKMAVASILFTVFFIST
jgi:hypothetical protein